MELKAQISAITGAAKEGEEAEAEATADGGGPLVTEQDIANIVAQWTGIPVEKVPVLAPLLVGVGREPSMCAAWLHALAVPLVGCRALCSHVPQVGRHHVRGMISCGGCVRRWLLVP